MCLFRLAREILTCKSDLATERRCVEASVAGSDTVRNLGTVAGQALQTPLPILVDSDCRVS